MKEIIITTESGNDLPQHLVDKYNIHVVPMHITMDGKTYDDQSIPVQNIYDYFDKTSKVPTTSAANVYDFITVFTKIREEYPDNPIFHLAYSAVTTCSYQNAQIAAEDFDNIYLIDTKNVTGGATAFIVKAVELIREREKTIDGSKESYESLAKELSEMASKIHFSFLPGNLNFLKAGGRLSNAAFLGAVLLRIKPLIEIIDGKLVATKKYLGSTDKLIPKFIQEFVTEHNISKKSLFVVATEGLAESAKQRIRETMEKLGVGQYELNPCGLVITCHSGPASIGIGGWEKSLD